MEYGRLLSFAVVIVGGGLLQLGAFIMVLHANGHSVTVIEVLGDGGLFFFATSLFAGSTISLFDKLQVEVGKKDFNITMLSLIGIFFPALTYYSAVLGDYSGVLLEHSLALSRYPKVLANGGISAVQADSLLIKMFSSEKIAELMANPKPFSNHIFLQIACAFIAVAFWYYSGLRTGLFVKTKHD